MCFLCLLCCCCSSLSLSGQRLLIMPCIFQSYASSFFSIHFSLLFLVSMWSNNVFSVHNTNLSSQRTSKQFFFCSLCPTGSRATIFHFLFQQQTKGIESIFTAIHFQCKSSIRISAHAFDASETKKENLQKKLFNVVSSIASAQF